MAKHDETELASASGNGISIAAARRKVDGQWGVLFEVEGAGGQFVPMDNRKMAREACMDAVKMLKSQGCELEFVHDEQNKNEC